MISIIHRVYKLIIDNVKNKLIDLFENKIFDINTHITLLTILKTNMVYENALTMEIKFQLEEEIGENEYFIYNINKILSSDEFNKLFNETKLFNLTLKIIETNNTFDIVYDPNFILPNNINIPNELFEEYIDVYNLFNNLFIVNHKKYYSVNEKLRISLALNGKIYNRPDREYYIVMESSEIYNIHVYKLNSNNKREKQLFIMWIDIINNNIMPLIFK